MFRLPAALVFLCNSEEFRLAETDRLLLQTDILFHAALQTIKNLLLFLLLDVREVSEELFWEPASGFQSGFPAAYIKILQSVQRVFPGGARVSLWCASSFCTVSAEFSQSPESS